MFESDFDPVCPLSRPMNNEQKVPQTAGYVRQKQSNFVVQAENYDSAREHPALWFSGVNGPNVAGIGLEDDVWVPHPVFLHLP
jgi:hypothetical protein